MNKPYFKDKLCKASHIPYSHCETKSDTCDL